jgi:hypothetical protein
MSNGGYFICDEYASELGALLPINGPTYYFVASEDKPIESLGLIYEMEVNEDGDVVLQVDNKTLMVTESRWLRIDYLANFVDLVIKKLEPRTTYYLYLKKRKQRRIK